MNGMKVYSSASDLIGGTPLVRLTRFAKLFHLKAELIAKLEFMNPTGSVKDRVALAMIDDAEKDGRLKRGAVIIEPTSGNTGIGLTSVAAVRGYRVVLTMPDTMSDERRKLFAAYGAELVLTDGAKGMVGAIEKATELAAELPGSFIPGQFTNPVNVRVHEETTGPEIWEDSGKKIDFFVAGVGTGGTVTGTGKYLRHANPNVKIIAVEPAGSPMLSENRAGAHGIQGIGANFLPELLDIKILDEIIKVTDEDAFKTSRKLARSEGIFAGISSGAALWAAVQIAAKEENTGKTVVTILPDTGERYLSLL
jgi:cysteine synthase A